LQLTLDIPDEVLVALGRTDLEAGNELRLAAATKLCEMGRLYSGADAGLAGAPRVVFLSRLADYGVDSFSVTAAELARETPLR